MSIGLFTTSLILIHLLSSEALAAENPEDWRPVFDLVMRWVNFLILAGLLIKFSRLPIKSFLAGKKEEVAREIEALESEKNNLLDQIAEHKNQIKSSQERMEALKRRIIAQGEKNKLKIIADAEHESRILLTSAQRKIESRIAEVREALKSELVDDAIALAMQRLPAAITEQDNQKFVDAFIQGAAD
jgi:F-type H+-transporting ATPase subunit b